MRNLILFLLLHISAIVNAQTCNEVPITNQTYSTNTTIFGCTVNLENVNMDNNANLIVNSEKGITISGEFNLNAGSSFETGFAQIFVPTLATNPVTGIAGTSAVSGGNVTSDGGSPVTDKGICWSTSENPTIDNSYGVTSFYEGGIGSYSVVMIGLSPSTTYWVRAYATNAVGTSYGTPISFTTPQPTAGLIQASINGGPTGVGLQYTVVLSSAAVGTKYFSVTHTNPTNSGNITENITVNNGATTGTLYVVYQNQITSYNAFCDFDGPQAGYTITTSQLSFFMAALLKPTLAATTVVSSITQQTATSGGNVTSDGGSPVTDRGICWSTSQNPTIANSTSANGSGTGSYSGNLTGLTASTTYYVRSYAINSAGIAYGAQTSFTTLPPPVVVPTLAATSAVTGVTCTTAYSGGNVTSDGGGTITSRGVCYGTTSNPTTANSITTDSGTTGSWTSATITVVPGTLYYVRSYATNSAGTGYGIQVTYTQNIAYPMLATTTAASSITSSSAVSGGNVTSDGCGTVTSRGICWATTQNPTMANSTAANGTGTGTYTGNLTGLSANTTYYVRSYATNSAGTAYGVQTSFTTSPPPVVVPTLAATSTVTGVTCTTAYSGGNVSSDGGGTITSRGICYGTTSNPTTANSITTDSGTTGLWTSGTITVVPGTLYYVRSYATNSAGTVYGTQVTYTQNIAYPMLATTTAASSITSSSAVSGGKVTSDGCGTVTSRGICWATTQNPTMANSTAANGTGTGTYTGNLTGLSANTTYYVRSYATNSAGTAYGVQTSFTTLPPPVVVPTLAATSAVTGVTCTTAYSGGNVTSDGGGTIISRGVCYGTTSNPTTANSITTDSGTTGSWTSGTITVVPGTLYYVRSYATNSAGTGYGTQVIYQRSITVPVLAATTNASNITSKSASSGGNVASDGCGTIVTRGICFATSQNPTIDNSVFANGSGTGTYTCDLIGLTANTNYYARSFAINNAGTVAYGTQISFTTLTPPVVVPTLAATSAVTGVTCTTAYSGGNVTSDGGGTITSRGICYGTTSNPTTANSITTDSGTTGSWTSATITVVPGTLYYMRSYATNSTGTGYGTQVTYTQNIAYPMLATTTAASSITSSSAISGGNVTSDGCSTVTVRGICWGTTQNPTTTSSKIVNGTGTGTYTGNLTGLSANTTYYVRSYATNSAGTAYGVQTSFTTLPPPVVVPTLAATSAVTGVTCTTAYSGGNVTSDGGGTITSRGVCYGTTSNPTTANSITTDSGTTGSWTSGTMTVVPGTLYYLRSYATNSAGTGYGTQVTYTQNIAYPMLATTTVASSITSSSAISGGNVTSDGCSTVTVRGICWGTTQNPTTTSSKIVNGTGTGTYTGNITGLSANTTYYVRSYATNSAGTTYGVQTSFTTSAVVVPTLATTTAVSSITCNSASSGGNVTSDGCGTVTARGICWATTQTPTTANSTSANGSGIGTYTGSLTGLAAGTTYYVRSYAINSAGTAYGVQTSFTTSAIVVPTLATTTAVGSITCNTASSGGNVTSDGCGTVTARGICWATTQKPTTSNSTIACGSGTGSYTGNLTGLTAGTTYYVRSYATNSAGTSYGTEVTFTSSSITASISYQVFNTTPTITVIGWFANLTAAAPSGNTIPAIITNASGSGTHTAGGYVAQGQSSQIMIETVSYSRLVGSNYTATCSFGTMPAGYVAGATGSVTILKQ